MSNPEKAKQLHEEAARWEARARNVDSCYLPDARTAAAFLRHAKRVRDEARSYEGREQP
jgi:hypothetical protein